MGVVLLFLCALMGYLLGSVNSSVIVGKLYKIDIRAEGSGNAGLTNTLRVLGKKAAVMVLAGDILKGVLAVAVGILAIVSQWSDPAIGEIYAVTAGTFAVIGHNWPVYFGFRGGKGILTTATVIFMLDWRIGLFVLVLFILIVAISGYVSLGSIVGSIAVPLAAWFFGHNIFFILFMIFLGILAVFRHKANIKRLIEGNENKLSFGSKKERVE